MALTTNQKVMIGIGVGGLALYLISRNKAAAAAPVVPTAASAPTNAQILAQAAPQLAAGIQQALTAASGG
jgi:hypothetical protein